MTVFVDPLHLTMRSRKWPYDQACHMVADTEDELHQMADRLGLRRRWYQVHSVLPHYDLTPNKRRQALALGAVEISFQDIYKRIQIVRKVQQI